MVGKGVLARIASSRLTRGTIVLLAIPLTIFVVEEQFKLSESRVDRARESRQETVQQTHDIWREVFSLGVQVALYEEGDGTDLAAVQKRLYELVVPAEQVVHQWSQRLTSIDADDESALLGPLNVMLTTTQTTVDALLTGEDARDLQNGLLAILDGVKAFGHHGTMQVLAHASSVEDARLVSWSMLRWAADDGGTAACHEASIDYWVSGINDWMQSVTAIEQNLARPFEPAANDDERAEYLAARQAYLEALAEGSTESAVETSGVLAGAVGAIPLETRLGSVRTSYPPEYITELADWLHVESEVWYLADLHHRASGMESQAFDAALGPPDC